MDVPASLYHRPVCLVTVHGNRHTAAARRNASVECIVIKLPEHRLQLINILQSGSLRYITAIQQRVHANLCDPLFLGLLDHSDQMRDVGVNIAVGKKTDKVQLAAILLQIIYSALPGIRLINLAGLNALINELGSLRIDLTAAKCVVAYLRIAHVVIAGKADCRTACLDRGVRPLGHELINLRLVSMHNRISLVLLCPANAVHYYQNYWFHIKSSL